MITGHCAYCGDPEAPDVEHVVPASRRGSNDATNLVSACQRCNGSKGGRTPDEWLRGRSLQSRVARYHARQGRPDQLALRLDIPDWWGKVSCPVADDLWRDFGLACTDGRSADQGRHSAVNRSALLREFIEWYVRRPGAKMPRRPAVKE